MVYYLFVDKIIESFNEYNIKLTNEISNGKRNMIINEKYQAMKVAINVITFCCLKFEYLFNKYKTIKNSPTISTINGAADIISNI